MKKKTTPVLSNCTLNLWESLIIKGIKTMLTSRKKLRLCWSAPSCRQELSTSRRLCSLKLSKNSWSNRRSFMSCFSSSRSKMCLNSRKTLPNLSNYLTKTKSQMIWPLWRSNILKFANWGKNKLPKVRSNLVSLRWPSSWKFQKTTSKSGSLKLWVMT